MPAASMEQPLKEVHAGHVSCMRTGVRQSPGWGSDVTKVSGDSDLVPNFACWLCGERQRYPFQLFSIVRGCGPDRCMSPSFLPVYTWLLLYILSYEFCLASLQVVIKGDCSAI